MFVAFFFVCEKRYSEVRFIWRSQATLQRCEVGGKEKVPLSKTRPGNFTLDKKESCFRFCRFSFLLCLEIEGKSKSKFDVFHSEMETTILKAFRRDKEL